MMMNEARYDARPGAVGSGLARSAVGSVVEPAVRSTLLDSTIREIDVICDRLQNAGGRVFDFNGRVLGHEPSTSEARLQELASDPPVAPTIGGRLGSSVARLQELASAIERAAERLQSVA